MTAPAPNHRRFGYLLALAIFLADQLVKWVVIYQLHLPRVGRIDVVPFFALSWVENRGISMGFLTAGSELERWGLVVLTAAIATVVAVWLWKEKRRPDAIGLAMVLGGALGNILDRTRLGYVADFLDLHIGEWRPFLVFNVADAAITLGVLLLLFRALLTRDEAPQGVSTDA